MNLSAAKRNLDILNHGTPAQHIAAHSTLPKLQALIYDILPPSTALIDHAKGPEEVSAANGQFFVGAQMTVSL